MGRNKEIKKKGCLFMFIKKFLKSGFVPFTAGVAIIMCYYFLAFNFLNYKVGGDINGSISILNVLFSFLFLISCCVLAFFYGKSKNKSGLIGLICIFVLPAVSGMILIFFPASYYVLPIPLYYIFFAYVTLLLSPQIFFAFFEIIIIIALMIGLWFIGKRRN
jgi:phosphate/sulfate permease